MLNRIILYTIFVVPLASLAQDITFNSINNSYNIPNTTKGNDIIFINGFENQQNGDLKISILDTSLITISSVLGNNELSDQQNYYYTVRVENVGFFAIETAVRDSYPIADLPNSQVGFDDSTRTWDCVVTEVGPNSFYTIGESCGFGTTTIDVNYINLSHGDILDITTSQIVLATDLDQILVSATVIASDTNQNDVNLANNEDLTLFQVTTNSPPIFSNLNTTLTLLEDSSNYMLNYSLSDLNNDQLFISASSTNDDILNVTSINNSQLTINPQTNRFGAITLTLSAADGHTVSTEYVDIEIIPVNDPPTFTLTDDGLNTIDIVHDISPPASLNITQLNFISNISMGPYEDDLAQSLEQLAIQSGDSHYGQISDMSIFLVAPYLDNNKNLHYILSDNATGGKAYFKVRMQDDGGLLNGGFNASAKFFTIENVPIKWQLNAVISGLESGNILEIKSANISSNVVITSNGTYNFPKLVDGSNYVIAVKVNPNRPNSVSNQTCLIGSGTFESGVIIANVNVNIIYTTNQYSVTGKVYGLDRSFDGGTNSNLIIKNNSGDDITINANYTYNNNGYYEFTFPLQDDNSGYSVSLINPSSPHQTCYVTDGAGIIPGANVTKVRIDCAIDTFTVGGAINGLINGNYVGLKINGANGILRGNGLFIFPGSLDDLENYTVTISNLPNNQTCTITSYGSGAINNANITNVAVACN